MKKNYQKPQSLEIMLLPYTDVLGVKVGSGVVSGSSEYNPIKTE